MTEKLKALMERTAEVDFAPVDLRAIATAGDRTVRRRRLALGGALVALVLVAGGAAVALRGGADKRDHVAEDPSGAPLGVVTWTWDRELHTTSASYPLGHEVKAYVRTAVGYAFVDPEGVVYSSVDGKVARIGESRSSEIRLVADDEGSLVGWVQEDGEPERFMTYDLRTREAHGFSRRADLGGNPEEGDENAFYAIDGRTAYVRDRRALLAVDVDTGVSQVLDPSAGEGSFIAGVEDGQIAFVDGAGDVRVGRSTRSAPVLTPVSGSTAAFSPDARYLSLDADEPTVYEVGSGRRVPIDIDGRVFGAGYEWLDASTLVLIASRTEVGPAELLTCVVPRGTCTQVVADLGPFAELEGRIALPHGAPAE